MPDDLREVLAVNPLPLWGRVPNFLEAREKRIVHLGGAQQVGRLVGGEAVEIAAAGGNHAVFIGEVEEVLHLAGSFVMRVDALQPEQALGF